MHLFLLSVPEKCRRSGGRSQTAASGWRALLVKLDQPPLSKVRARSEARPTGDRQEDWSIVSRVDSFSRVEGYRRARVFHAGTQSGGESSISIAFSPRRDFRVAARHKFVTLSTCPIKNMSRRKIVPSSRTYPITGRDKDSSSPYYRKR